MMFGYNNAPLVTDLSELLSDMEEAEQLKKDLVRIQQKFGGIAPTFVSSENLNRLRKEAEEAREAVPKTDPELQISKWHRKSYLIPFILCVVLAVCGLVLVVCEVISMACLFLIPAIFYVVLTVGAFTAPNHPVRWIVISVLLAAFSVVCIVDVALTYYNFVEFLSPSDLFELQETATVFLHSLCILDALVLIVISVLSQIAEGNEEVIQNKLYQQRIERIDEKYHQLIQSAQAEHEAQVAAAKKEAAAKNSEIARSCRAACAPVEKQLAECEARIAGNTLLSEADKTMDCVRSLIGYLTVGGAPTLKEALRTYDRVREVNDHKVGLENYRRYCKGDLEWKDRQREEQLQNERLERERQRLQNLADEADEYNRLVEKLKKGY